MRRGFALVAAAGMIAGSLFVRARLDDRNERARTVVRLVCATELRAVCDALARSRAPRVETSVEPAAETAARLSQPGTVGLDGWLVMPPWPDAVDSAREQAGLTDLFSIAATPIARSPLVLVVSAQRQPVLRARCGGTIGWKCVGDVAPQMWSEIGGQAEWGRVKPWHAAAPTEATGLLAVGQATAAYFGRTDVSTIDLDDGGYLDWLNLLELAVRRTDGSVATILTAPAQVDLVATTEADAGPQIVTAAATEKPAVLYPQPVATADVVLARVAGSRVAPALQVLVNGAGRDALAVAGWRVEGEPLAAGLAANVALPKTSGLPRSGLLIALRSRLAEIR